MRSKETVEELRRYSLSVFSWVQSLVGYHLKCQNAQQMTSGITFSAVEAVFSDIDIGQVDNTITIYGVAVEMFSLGLLRYF